MRGLPLLVLFACTGDGHVLGTWDGMYEVQQMNLAEATCEGGPEIEPDPPVFEIDTAVGDEAHLVAIRQCQRAGDCPGLSWFEAIVVKPTETKLKGDTADYNYSDVNGSCLVQWVEMILSRQSQTAPRVSVEIEVHSGITTTEDEQGCVDFMIDSARGDDCDLFYEIEGKRVP
jgi:hypothetical protein